MSRPWQILAGMEPPPLQSEQQAAKRKALLGEQQAELSLDVIRQQLETAKANAAEASKKARIADQVRAARAKGGDPASTYRELLASDPEAADAYREAYNKEQLALNPENQPTPEFAVGAAPMAPGAPTGAIPQNLEGGDLAPNPVSVEAQNHVVALPATPANVIDMSGNARDIFRRSARQVAEQGIAKTQAEEAIKSQNRIAEKAAEQRGLMVEVPFDFPEFNIKAGQKIPKDSLDNLITAMSQLLKPKDQKIDENSPEGIAARLEFEREKARIAAQYRVDPEAIVNFIGPDDQPTIGVRMRGSDTIKTLTDAAGKPLRPASSREQGRPVTSGDANRIADFDTSLNDLATLRQTIPAGTTGTVAKIGAALPDAITNALGWNTPKQKQATIDRVKQVIGKALEGGVLRKEDEYKYEKILPKIADSDAVVKTKLDGLDRAIAQRRQTELDALDDAGYDVSKFRARGSSVETSPASGWRIIEVK